MRTAAGEPVVGVELVLLAGPAGASVTVINWGGVPLDAPLRLSLELPPGAGFARSAAPPTVLDAWTGQTLAASMS